MGDAKQCDRCKGFYTEEELMQQFEYTVNYKGGNNIDLCLKCLTQLANWILKPKGYRRAWTDEQKKAKSEQMKKQWNELEKKDGNN